jgi:hypothetical protein
MTRPPSYIDTGRVETDVVAEHHAEAHLEGSAALPRCAPAPPL